MSAEPADGPLDALLTRLPRPSADAHLPEATLEAHARAQLAPAEATAVEQHLAACADCRAYWVGLRQPPGRPLLHRMVAATPARRSRGTFFVGFGVLAAAAAGLFFWLRAVPDLPPYALEGPWGGVQLKRSEPAAPSQVFLPHSRLSLALKPQAATAGPPEAAAYVAPNGGTLRRLPAGVLQHGEGGVVLLEAPAAELFGTQAGAYTIHLVVGSSRDFSGLAPDAARAAAPEAAWHHLSVDYRTEVP